MSSPRIAGYLSTVGIVIVGLLLGYQAKSIAHIWNWLMMALGAGVLIPNFLRWYWWRMNGWGYSLGTIVGILLSLVVLFIPDLPMYAFFPPIVLSSFAVCIIGSLLTAPVDEDILIKFFRTIRPFGLWNHIKKRSGLSFAELSSPTDRASVAILNTVLGMFAATGFYLFPIYLVGHWHIYSMICIAVAFSSCFILAFTWYKNLPAAGTE